MNKQVGGTHYEKAVQPFDLIKAMETSGNPFVDFARGNVIKYAFRFKKDMMAEDLRKAAHYCIEAAEVLEANKMSTSLDKK